MGALAGQFGAAPATVRSQTLDRLVAEAGLSRVDMVKVDVEGFEAAVFRGAKGMLTGPAPPILIFEFLDWAERRSGESLGAAQRLLLEYGYRLEVLGNSRQPLAEP